MFGITQSAVSNIIKEKNSWIEKVTNSNALFHFSEIVYFYFLLGK
jgi:predicted transcriptional regulator